MHLGTLICYLALLLLFELSGVDLIMGLGDNPSGGSTGAKHLNCEGCNNAITSKSFLVTTICGHNFHKECLAKVLKLRPFCPVCDERVVSDGPQKNTRAQTLPGAQGNESDNVANAASVSGATGNSVINPTIPTLNSQAVLPTATPAIRPITQVIPPEAKIENLHEIIASIVAAQQSQLLSTLSSQMAALEARLSTSALSSPSVNRTHSAPVLPSDQLQTQSQPAAQTHVQRTPPHQMQNLHTIEQRTFRELLGLDRNLSDGNSAAQPRSELDMSGALNRSASRGASASNLNVRPDKILQIISNWKIRFNGGPSSLSVENFIYRVEALTAQTLQGDFGLLCNHAALLFEGKANDWFWRYHQSVMAITWRELCAALRKQYKDSRTDVDLCELIRDRKQKPSETFDSFYESIVALTDRLVEPLAEGTLVEILRRNLLPEIQHEILNIQVNSVEDLRDLCRRREFFLQDIRRKHGLQATKTAIQRRLAEIESDFGEEEIDLAGEGGNEISALSLVCWNCNKPGHRYQDCLSDRTIFCYGCGTPDVYKPNCKKCASKNGRTPAQRGTHKPPNQSELELE